LKYLVLCIHYLQLLPAIALNKQACRRVFTHIIGNATAHLSTYKKMTMNYLAHAYLSFNHPEILVGNMISDYVKGKAQYDYPAGIHTGIRLHRDIDTFTDNHDATRQAKEFFRKDYRLYAGAFVDVIYDHYLATDKTIFSTTSHLQQTADFTYSTLQTYKNWLPDRFSPMLPYMQSQNWLYNYQFAWGIERSLAGVVRRSKYLQESEKAFASFQEHYETLRTCYDAFFPEIMAMVKTQLNDKGFDVL